MFQPVQNGSMLWEGRVLREIGEADVRRLIDTELGEHLQLEYKSAPYENNDRGNREFLQDICMFANTAGGVLLIGISERRDEQGQPTGLPDPTAQLGIELPNPEAILGAYDARITASVEERLPLEMAAIEVGEGRYILAIRIPDSVRKPHAVVYQGHIYFPGRRERQRYALSVREIKELTMRTASHLELSKDHLSESFRQVTLMPSRPYLVAGLIPVFSEDFLVDLRLATIQQAVRMFGRAIGGEFGNISYSFDGIERRDARFDHIVQLRRNGLLRVSQQLPISEQEGLDHVRPLGIDRLLRQVFGQARSAYETAGIGPPYMASVTLTVQRELMGLYPSAGGPWEEPAALVEPDAYRFPFMQIDDFINMDRILRPFCDQVHQLFGKEGSSSFNADGRWIETNR
jgi:hypothetical protein